MERVGFFDLGAFHDEDVLQKEHELFAGAALRFTCVEKPVHGIFTEKFVVFLLEFPADSALFLKIGIALIQASIALMDRGFKFGQGSRLWQDRTRLKGFLHRVPRRFAQCGGYGLGCGGKPHAAEQVLRGIDLPESHRERQPGIFEGEVFWGGGGVWHDLGALNYIVSQLCEVSKKI